MIKESRSSGDGLPIANPRMGNTLSNFDWAFIVMLFTAKKRMIREKSLLFMAAFINQFTIYRNTALHAILS
jgi:hypothetical protein